jgi:hypothetical protein
MRIDQRNAGASVTPTNGQYLVDRFYAGLTQASKFSTQQNASAVTLPKGFTNYLGATSLSAFSVASGDTFFIQQVVEGFNVADLGWGAAGAQSVTLSFWVRSSLTGTFGGSVMNSAANRAYPFTFALSAANTWENKTITVAGDVAGTWLTTNGSGLRLSFSLGTGSTLASTAGAWATGNFLSATGATSVVGTSGATFYVTGVQLEKGSTATTFDYRDYGRELNLCQRYYELVTGFGIYAYIATSATTAMVPVMFKVSKRVSPTLGAPSAAAVSNANTITTYAPTTEGFHYGANAVSAGMVQAWQASITASAEL